MRKPLFAAVATTFAALAFASPAVATEAITVVTEPGGVICTTSTCYTGITNSGNIELRGHLFGFESHSIDCNMVFLLRIAANGSGHVPNLAITPGDEDCSSITGCAMPWTFTAEETATGVSQLDLSLCLEGTPLGECEGTIAFNFHESFTNHRYFLTVNDGSLAGESFGSCELTGAFNQSGQIGGFEVVHQ